MKPKKNNKKSSGRLPNPIDVHVGSRIRLRRKILGVSQTALAEALGLSFQQVQEYERGTNRVSSSRLFDLCRILNVQLAYFFDEMGNDVAKQSPGALQGRAPMDIPQDPAAKRETLALVRAYYGIADQRVRQKLIATIRAIAMGDEAVGAG